MIEMPTNTKPLWLQGDVLERLADIPDDCIQCCICSPPYWGLRKYIDDDSPDKEYEIGLEPTLQEWIDKMVEVFREVRRVLRPDGTLWLNIGDAYNSSNTHTGKADKVDWGIQKVLDAGANNPGTTKELKPKDCLMMDYRLALALQADGWWVRSKIVWHKPNPMPESCRDRPTSSYEMIFLLTKSARYFYDADAIREPQTGNAHSRGNGVCPKEGKQGEVRANEGFHRATSSIVDLPAGRNSRNVWTIPTQPNPLAHFATFPPELVRRCIAAGTSEKGCCKKCGKPWERVTEKPKPPKEVFTEKTTPKDGLVYGGAVVDGEWKGMGQKLQNWLNEHPTQTLGWRPGCDCEKGSYVTTRPCIVLDCFAGIGTTLAVAARMDRASVGIELNQQYIDDGLPDVEAAFKGITRKEVEAGQEVLFE